MSNFSKDKTKVESKIFQWPQACIELVVYDREAKSHLL